MLQRWLPSLSVMNQPRLVSNRSSEASSPLSAFIKLEEIRALLWMGFGLRECCGWADLLSRPVKHYLYQNSTLWFLIIHGFTGVAPPFSFKNFSFAFTTWLSFWRRRPSFWPVLAFNIPHHSAAFISKFWLKVGSVTLTQTLKGHWTVTVWPNCNTVSRNRKAWKEGGWESWLVQSEYTHLSVNVHCLVWSQFTTPQNNYNSNSKVTDHRSP